MYQNICVSVANAHNKVGAPPEVKNLQCSKLNFFYIERIGTGSRNRNSNWEQYTTTSKLFGAKKKLSSISTM